MQACLDVSMCSASLNLRTTTMTMQLSTAASHAKHHWQLCFDLHSKQDKHSSLLKALEAGAMKQD